MDHKIGIIGFGVVGKSALQFLTKSRCSSAEFPHISIWDERALNDEELSLIETCNATYNQTPFEHFLDQHDSLIVSPGITLHSLEKYKHKIKGELDIFYQHFKKPSIAITGTLGKTTLTKYLTSLINHISLSTSCVENFYLKALYGGNVGVGMLDLIPKQEECDIALLELSSFQLELNKSYAPDIALWSNIYPNHIDWHVNFEHYCAAKMKLFMTQKKDQTAILAASLSHALPNHLWKSYLETAPSAKCVIYDIPFTTEEKKRGKGIFTTGFFLKGHDCFIYDFASDKEYFLISLKGFDSYTFLQNWLFIVATLHIIGFEASHITSAILSKIQREAHRVEKCNNVKNVEFFNDSKATIPQATHAALERLIPLQKPIILILGGYYRGGDRKQFSAELSKIKEIKKIICFGKECADFAVAEGCDNLEEAVSAAVKHAQSGDIVLFSPAGSSLDQFKNYIERGETFKRLVASYEQS